MDLELIRGVLLARRLNGLLWGGCIVLEDGILVYSLWVPMIEVVFLWVFIWLEKDAFLLTGV
jgi:hypothetical protein